MAEIKNLVKAALGTFFGEAVPKDYQKIISAAVPNGLKKNKAVSKIDSLITQQYNNDLVAGFTQKLTKLKPDITSEELGKLQNEFTQQFKIGNKAFSAEQITDYEDNILRPIRNEIRAKGLEGHNPNLTPVADLGITAQELSEKAAQDVKLVPQEFGPGGLSKAEYTDKDAMLASHFKPISTMLQERREAAALRPKNSSQKVKLKTLDEALEPQKFAESTTYESQGGLFSEFVGQVPEEKVGTVVEEKTKKSATSQFPSINGADAAIEGEMALFDPVQGQGTLMDQLKERVARRKSGTLTPTQESNRIRQEAANEKLRRQNEAGKRNAERRAAAYMKQNVGNISENPYDKYKYWGSNATEEQIIAETVPELPINENTAWGSTAKAALGTAVVGAGICAALSSSRGQQNNAQLYGQQPLY